MQLKDVLQLIAAALIATVTFFMGECNGKTQSIPATPVSNEAGEQESAPEEPDNSGTDSEGTTEKAGD